MPITDKQSFLMGVQVGRRLKAWDAAREREQERETVDETDEQEEEPNG